MYTSFAVVSLFAAAVAAQSSTSPADSAIPTGISSGCADYLTSLNSGSSLSACIAAIQGPTAAFGPGNSTNATTAAMTSALTTLCGSSVCSEGMFRTELASMWSACTNELSGDTLVPSVLTIYDVLYNMYPLKQALCGLDDSGNFCALQVSDNIADSTSTSTASSSLSNALVSEGSVDLTSIEQNLYYTPGSVSRRETELIPNTTTIGASNLLFMFLTPNTSPSTLCSTCTRQTIVPYLNFRSDCPYGPGIDESPMLPGLNPLYTAIVGTCGANFLSQSVAAAGSLGTGSSSDGSSTNGAQAVVLDFKVAIAAALGVTTLFITL